MVSSRRSVRAFKVLLVLSLALILLAAGGYVLHGQRKRAAVQRALAAGVAAYDAQRWSEAAAQLGRYLTAENRNVDVLMKYAYAQMRRRPRPKGCTEQAIGALENVARIQRGHPEACQTLVQFYLTIGAPIEAERIARAWLEASPDDPQAQQSLAAALLQQEGHDQALELLEKVVANHPERIDAASALALLRISRKHQSVEQAGGLLDAAVAAGSDNAAARIARARFFRAVGRPAEALQEAQKAEQLAPDTAAAAVDLATLMHDMGLYARADAQFDRAERMAPSSPDAYLARAQGALAIGGADGGAAVAERALAAPLGELRMDVLPLAAELYAAAGQPADARRCIEEIEGMDATLEVLPYLRAATLLAEGRTHESLAALQEIARRTPKAAKVHLALGRAHARAGDLRRAAAALQECLRADDPPTPIAQIELSEVCAALGSWQDAANAAAQAQRRRPYDVRAIMTSIEMQGRIARPGGPRPDAAAIDRLRERAEQLCQQTTPDVRPRILLARLTAWGGRLDEAVAMLDALRQTPDAAVAAGVVLADVLAEAGRYDDAIRECQAAIAAAPADRRSVLQVHLAELYGAKGDPDHAVLLARTLADDPARAADPATVTALARLVLRQNQPDAARELLAKAAAKAPHDVACRAMWLALLPADATHPSRQELIDQIRRIEGEAGLHWRLWQARVWLEAPDWRDRRQAARALLNECLSRDPGFAPAAAALAQDHERTDEVDEALTFYRRALQADPADAVTTRRYLALASRAQHWSEVDRLLAALPADDPSLEPYRIAQALRAGDAARAEAALRAMAQADPRNFTCRLQLARLKRAQGDHAQADQLLAEAAGIAPDAPEVLQARVQAHVDRAEWDKALELCNQAFAQDPRPDLLALRAGVYMAQGRPEPAEQDLRRLLQVEDWAQRAWLALGELYWRQEEPAKAIQTWREGVAAAPESAALRRALAAGLLAGDPTQREEGTRLLQELLQAHPDDPDLLMMQAERIQAADPAEAQRIYERIVQQNPSAAEAFARLTRLAADQGRPDRALELAETGLAANPRHLDLLLQKMELLQAQSPARAALVAGQAATVAMEVLNLQPSNPSAVIALARARAATGQREQAITELEALLARGGSADRLEARLVLAGIHLSVGHYAQADEQIRRCAQQAPDDPRPVLLKLRWHAAQGQWDALVAAADAFRRGRPQDVSVARAAARYLMDAGGSEHVQAALTMLAHAARLLPDDAQAQLELGLGHYRLGRIDQAKSVFARALQAHPRHVGLANNLAWILCEEQNDPQAAERVGAGLIEAGAGAAGYPSLLDTWGVVQYRLAVLEKSAQRLAESQRRLEECLRHPRTEPSTRAAATFHLARALAESQPDRSRALLAELLGDPARLEWLSPGDRQEAQRLLETLAGSPRTAASAPQPEELP